MLPDFTDGHNEIGDQPPDRGWCERPGEGHTGHCCPSVQPPAH